MECFAFDAISDRQIASAISLRAKVQPLGGVYRAVVVPACEHLPLATLEHLLSIAEDGGTIIFEKHLPKDVPGWGDLEKRRVQFAQVIARVKLNDGEATLGKGRVLVGEIESSLSRVGVVRESLVDRELVFIRRAVDGGHTYFIANRTDKAVDDWLTLGVPAASVAILDPMTGHTGYAAKRDSSVHVQLQAGESVILRAFLTDYNDSARAWPYWEPTGEPFALAGNWKVQFLDGGPERPPDFESVKLASWTEIGGAEAQRFAGTARYTLTFDAAPSASSFWRLDLGRVAQSARVTINGRDCGTLFAPPFQIELGELQKQGNELQIEVTNTSANRLRDLDRRGVKWRNFQDINVVNIDYKPFNAADWPLADSGLLGPVKLIPLWRGW